MKSASMPSLRVAPELRQAAEAILREGEKLSSFMEQSVRDPAFPFGRRLRQRNRGRTA